MQPFATMTHLNFELVRKTAGRSTLWMMGLLIILSIWGVTAVIIGIAFGGVGVVPIAMLATPIHGYWFPLIELVLLTVATFGCRIGALSLAQSLDEQSYA